MRCLSDLHFLCSLLATEARTSHNSDDRVPKDTHRSFPPEASTPEGPVAPLILRGTHPISEVPNCHRL